jgi:hypothetical protein
MKKLKMWIGNFDGSRTGLVIAASKERARQIVGTGRSDFENYWSLQTKVDDSLEAEVLYTCPSARVGPQKWQKGRCPL